MPIWVCTCSQRMQPHCLTAQLSCSTSHLQTTLLNYLASLFFTLSFHRSKTRHIALERLMVLLRIYTAAYTYTHPCTHARGSTCIYTNR